MADLFDTVPQGTRVVVRFRLTREQPSAADAETSRPRHSDAIGTLVAVERVDGERRVRILTRRGEVVVPTAAITHAKPVPPPPQRRTSK
jgi:hypothetical protein